jgi:hypothetical protein
MSSGPSTLYAEWENENLDTLGRTGSFDELDALYEQEEMESALDPAFLKLAEKIAAHEASTQSWPEKIKVRFCESEFLCVHDHDTQIP